MARKRKPGPLKRLFRKLLLYLSSVAAVFVAAHFAEKKIATDTALQIAKLSLDAPRAETASFEVVGYDNYLDRVHRFTILVRDPAGKEIDNLRIDLGCQRGIGAVCLFNTPGSLPRL